MIKKVKLKYFKRFEEEEFDLSEHVILAGPNNSGKSTLLQAIAVWNLALRRWLELRGQDSKATKRTGVPVTRKDFVTIPLRELNLLWTNTKTGLQDDELTGDQKRGAPRVLEITLEGIEDGINWSSTFEFRYQNTELIYIKPKINGDENPISPAIGKQTVVHIPPFSGIGPEETHYDRPFQDLLIGQGKAGDILRNLIYEVHKSSGRWNEFKKQIQDIFGYTVLDPEYQGRPYILAEYLPGIPAGKGKDGLPQFDIASAGSGFHQVLLIFAFLYARPASVLLLDEPDAHLHVVLQKQIYDRLRSVCAKEKSQLIIATHSEVLINSSNAEQITSFYGRPHALISNTEVDRVAEALKLLDSTDLLLAEQANGILYVEGESDFNLLKSWANNLSHPTAAWFNRSPFWKSNHGRNPKDARHHFFALKAVNPNIKAFLLLDGDNRNLPDQEIGADGLRIGRWTRYETESYLVHPEVLIRFIRDYSDAPLLQQGAEEYLRVQLPPVIYQDPLGQNDYLNATPASKTLLPGLFTAVHMELPKNEYFRIAEQMLPTEISNDVKVMLDLIKVTLGI